MKLKLILFALPCLLAFSSFAQSSEYYWYDGNKKKTITLNNTVHAVYANNKTTLKSGPNTNSANKTGFTSPVFYAGINTGPQQISLPGNIIIKFKANWSSEQIDSWLQSKNLIQVKKFPFANTYEIRTIPGLSSLNTANAIYESGEVAAASPNWLLTLEKY